ncbi:hypothetical protein RL832_04885 [Xanthomonas hortorum NBC5720]|nr:hypothetical protein [Xanthomonas hortorum NBC5720]
MRSPSGLHSRRQPDLQALASALSLLLRSDAVKKLRNHCLWINMKTLKFLLCISALLAFTQAAAETLRPKLPGQLNQGDRLVPEETLTSPGGAYSLRFLADGSLRLYRNSDNSETWVAKSGGRISQGDTFSFLPATPLQLSRCAAMQKNGASGPPLFWTCAPSSVRGMVQDGYLAVQDDGNIVIYGIALAWRATGDFPNGLDGLAFPAGTVFTKGSSFQTSGGNVRLTFTASGNLELYSGGSLKWQSGTSGAGETATMQTDGNFVIYSSAGNPVWASNTQGTDAFLSLSANGALAVLARAGGRSGVYWSLR